MREESKGVAAMVLACALWGFSGIYFDAIATVPPLEVLSHRVLWSALFFAALYAANRRLRAGLAPAKSPAALVRLGAAALLISINWLGYIWAVQNGRAADASLGYYIFPLLAVLLGALVFGERFTRIQALAIGLATLAVVVLTMGLGTPPWIALLLAASFSVYGMIKKTLVMGPLHSVAVEIVLVLPLALIYLAVLHIQGGGAFGRSLGESGLLILSALFTGLPLVFLSYASRRISYASLGLVQYLNPTLQFIVAITYLGEPFSPVRGLAFALIWAGVALFCLELWRQDSASRRLPVS